MKRRIVTGVVWSIFFAVVITAVAGYLYYRKVYYGTWNYSYEESTEFVNNPYQGVYVQVNLGDPEDISEKLEFYSDHTVVLLAFNLKDYIDESVIPEEKIEDLRSALEIIQERKLSAIFRGVYDLHGDYEDPAFEVMLGHIHQIGVVLNEYKDCIAGVQAGMIGAYGEWHSSDYMEDPSYYTQVISAWIEVLDSEIPIGIRRQKFIRDAQEYGVDITRLGIYNDGLFSSDSDLGTYMSEGYDRAAELKWSQDTLKVAFNGGEMPFVSEFSEINNVVAEAKQLSLSYLNRYYNTEVWDLWESQQYEGVQGDLYLKQYLGVRPWVKEVVVSKNFQKRKVIKVEIELQNSGFALIDSAWQPYLLLECDGVVEKVPVSLEMSSQKRGVIYGEIENPYWRDDLERVRIGLVVIRGEDTVEGYWLRLANEVELSEDGVYWFVDYKNVEQDE